MSDNSTIYTAICNGFSKATATTAEKALEQLLKRLSGAKFQRNKARCQVWMKPEGKPDVLHLDIEMDVTTGEWRKV